MPLAKSKKQIFTYALPKKKNTKNWRLHFTGPYFFKKNILF